MNSKKIIYISIIITILIFALSNIVFAKYYSNYNETIKARIATPIIELTKENNDNQMITATEGAELVLNVSNYNNENISEVGQNYYLQFYSDDIDISKLNIIVKMEEENIQINNGVTSQMYIKANQKETHKYNVKITSKTTEELKGNLQAKIISKQVEPK